MSFEDPMKKVASHGPEWVERRKQERSYINDHSSIFGHKLLEDASAGSVLPTERKETLFKNLKNDLLGYAQNHPDKFKAFIEGSLSRIDATSWAKLIDLDYEHDENFEDYYQPDLYQEQQKKPMTPAEVNIFRNKKIAQDIATLLEDNHHFIERMPLSALLPLLEQHAGEVMARQREMAPYFEKFKQAFAVRLLEKIRSGEYPLNESAAMERLKNVQCVVVDQMNADLREIWGDYQTSSHSVRIASDIPRQQRDSTMTHELFHALHGQTESVFYDLPVVMRSGVDVGANQELNWLNEAVTEQTAMDFMGRKGSKSYVNERKLLKKLYDMGLDRDILYKAYFENYEVKQPGQHRSPQLKAFFRHINDITRHPRFLFDLSAMIRALGADEVLKLWTKNKRFPEFVQKWVKENPISDNE